FPIANTAADETRPRVSDSNGRGAATNLPDGKAWTVVWERAHPLGGFAVEAAQIDAAGSMVVSPFTVHYNFGSDRRPEVSMLTDAPSPRRALVVWHRTSAPNGALGDVQGAIIENGVASPAQDLTTLDHPQGDGLVQSDATVASDGCRFLVAYSEEFFAGSSDLDVKASLFRFDGSQIVCDAPRESVATSSRSESSPAIASYCPGLSPNYYQHHYAIMWADQVAPSQHDIVGALHSGRSTGIMLDTMPTACGPATLFTAGDPVANSYFELGLSNVPASALQLMVIGIPASAPTPLTPNCLSGILDPPFLILDNVGTTAVRPELISVTVPCDAAFLGATLAFQGFAIGVIPGGETIPLGNGQSIGLTATDTLLVTFR
ncbi:MAG: hypothetical protein KDB53_17070, partial [Planctomycetes bacterium]|nr:hypothetical protein [Planctomycetota bacterium]